jgi:dihydrolipoamide dehydrogenase
VSPVAETRVDVVVLGAGPGGYTAAFRAADLGKRVALVERDAALGGVCLNVGCIPSKALLHLAEVVVEARALARHGVELGPPRFDLARIRAFKDGVVKRLTGGLVALAKRRGVEVVRGSGVFEGPRALRVEAADGERRIAFEHAIVAAGSRPVRLPGLPDDPRVLDSTSALELGGVPEHLLVVGGGIIGLEMASVYHALGSRIVVVELLDELLSGVDRDVVRPLQKTIESRYEKIRLGTKLVSVEAHADGLHAAFDGPGGPASDRFDAVLVAVGRRPNADLIGREAAGIELDAAGFVRVDGERRTSAPHVFAVGDVAGPPLLAHKAMHEGRVAAEVIAGLPARFDAAAIPGVAYTDPEVAWTGLSEAEAAREGRELRRAVFPWSASGRALGIDRSEGLTKLLLDPESGRILGAAIVGRNAGELISELGLAIEMGADAEDVALTIHPHPTLAETVGLAAEVATGTVTDLPPKRG